MGSSGEPTQRKEENPSPLPKYQIQNPHADDPYDRPADPASARVAKHRWNGTGICDDAERDNRCWNRCWNPNASPELVHALPRGDNGQLAGKRQVSIDDQLEMQWMQEMRCRLSDTD